MEDDDKYISPIQELSQFVGDYSQEVELCSYNEDTVRALWRKRQLTSNANRDPREAEILWKYRWPEYNKDTDLDAIMDDLVRKAGGWPVDWYPWYIDGIGRLTKAEKEMLGEFTCFPLEIVTEEIRVEPGVLAHEEPRWEAGRRLREEYKKGRTYEEVLRQCGAQPG